MSTGGEIYFGTDWSVQVGGKKDEVEQKLQVQSSRFQSTVTIAFFVACYCLQ